jgi:hypothetical protein
LGTELHVLIIDGQGIPYLLILTGAITHNKGYYKKYTLYHIIVKGSSYNINKEKQNLYLDIGRDFQDIENDVIKKGYLSHIRHRSERLIIKGGNRHTTKRRCIVGRTSYRHNRLRKTFG